MKKIKAVISFFLLFCIFFSVPYIYADDIVDDNIDDKQIQGELLEITTEPTKLPNVNSRATIIYDRTSHCVIYGKQENTKRPMASTTKIMTSIVVLENSNLSDTVEVSKKAAGTGGSRLGLKTGDKITVHDLLYGLMLCSGNDAAVALAEHVGGNIEGFAELMNKKAQELGLKDSHFVTPHGLDATQHFTTAYELARMADYALNIKQFATIVGSKNYTIQINGTPKNLNNTNELLGNLNGVYGVKTGFTNGANRCLVTSTKRGDLDIICVVLGADTKRNRTQDSAKLIEYAFANYQMIDLPSKVQQEFENWTKNNNISAIKGTQDILDIGYNMSMLTKYPINNSDINSIDIQIETVNEISAPIKENEVVGKIQIKIRDKEILSYDIVTKQEVKKKKIHDYLKDIVLHYSEYIEDTIKTE